MKFYGASHGISVEGPTLLRVGERSAGDKRFAQDEFVLAPPGTIVAPRPQNMKPTAKNAALAVMAQISGLPIEQAQHGAVVAGNAPQGAAAGPASPAQGGPAQGGPARGGAASITPQKACQILDEGVINGQPLTEPQVKFFTMVCGGGAAQGVPAQGGPAQGGAPGGGAIPPEALAMLQQVLAGGGGARGGGSSHLQGAADGAQVAPGAQSMAELLQELLGQGGFSIDMLLGIIGLMNSLGTIIPEAIGVTDVADLRDIIGGATGGNVPTLASRQFGEQQRLNNANIMAQLGVIIPGLLGQTGANFDAGLSRALDPGLRAATTNFEGGTGTVGDIGRAVRDRQPLETLAKQQQNFNQAITGFRSFGLGRPRPSVSPTAGV